MLLNKISGLLDVTYESMVEWRRGLHTRPELSYQETNTAAFVSGLLREWGYEVRENAGGGGVVGTLRGGGPYRGTVALRADMDALPIQDEKDCAYKSQVPGVMHACGHDAHTSTLLGLAKALAEVREQVPGHIVLLFQHAEELSPGGAAPMIEDGALNGVDAVYGVHLWTPLPYGHASSLEDAFMAAADEFVIDVVGKGGHGGLPHQTVDAIAVGAHLVVNLQSIVSRNVDPTEPCVISVGSLHGGNGFNVIAERASLVGTVRTFNTDTQALVRERIEQVTAGTCGMFGAEYTYTYKPGYPPVVNNREEFERFLKVARALMPETNVHRSPKIMAGEDFAYYLEQKPGCFMFVGAGNEELGFVYPHHHPRFDLDERAMLNAAKLLAAMALDRLGPDE